MMARLGISGNFWALNPSVDAEKPSAVALGLTKMTSRMHGLPLKLANLVSPNNYYPCNIISYNIINRISFRPNKIEYDWTYHTHILSRSHPEKRAPWSLHHVVAWAILVTLSSQSVDLLRHVFLGSLGSTLINGPVTKWWIKVWWSSAPMNKTWNPRCHNNSTNGPMGMAAMETSHGMQIAFLTSASGVWITTSAFLASGFLNNPGQDWEKDGSDMLRSLALQHDQRTSHDINWHHMFGRGHWMIIRTNMEIPRWHVTLEYHQYWTFKWWCRF